jgi:hypothetical protein
MKKMMIQIYNLNPHIQKIWNDNIDDHIGDTSPLIPITNPSIIKKYVLKYVFIIQSCNKFDHKTKKIEDNGFTISSNSMIMHG